jgi:hypothetical protein
MTMTYQVIKTAVVQTFDPGEWVELTPGQIRPPEVETLHWLAQLHLTLPDIGRPSYVKLQFCRHDGDTLDTTGTTTFGIPAALTSWQGTLTWTFRADPDVPISVRAYHNAAVPVKSAQRQIKFLTIPSA